MGWLHDEAGLQLGDTLLGFLRDSQPADKSTPYTINGDGILEGGFAPSIGYASRITGDTAMGLYVRGAVHYYLGVAYARTSGVGGFRTGDPIFGASVKPTISAVTEYSNAGNSLGHGVGGDVGVAWISGPIELGVGVNDIGATITWSDTRQDTLQYDTTSNSIRSTPGQNHFTTKTKLPVSYIANVAYTVGQTTLGADVLNNGRGTTVHVGGEQRIGLFALRGGVARDQRKRIEFGWGGGVRLGAIGLDVGFWTHTNSISNERGITMATSLSIY